MTTHDDDARNTSERGKKDLARRNVLTGLLLAGIVLAIYLTYLLLVFIK